ncbi:hypothetical protein NL529_33015, partial [Klebsiella pneumoniae]|nr:hypothetical protein [Klebsiella pneumoniae]
AMPPEQALDQPEEAPPVPLTDEEKAALAEALNYDPMVTMAEKSGRPLKLPGRNDRTILDLSGTRKANGSGTMVLKPGLPQ